MQALEGDVEVWEERLKLEIVEVDRGEDEFEDLCAFEFTLDEELVEEASVLEAEQMGVVYVLLLEGDFGDSR